MGETARLLALPPPGPPTRPPMPPGSSPQSRRRGRVSLAQRDPRDPTPARVAIAEQHGDEVAVDLAGFGAIAITGAGADGLARACLVGLLAAGDSAAVEVLLVGERLIPDVGGFPGCAARPACRGAECAGSRAGASCPAAGGQ